MKKGDVTIGLTEIRIITEHYEELCVNKLGNIDKIENS